jgi:protein TonB
VSIVLGIAFSVALFVLMALAQMMGEVRTSENEFDEAMMAFNAPEVEEIEEVEEEAPPPLEEEELPPELEQELPQLSLDQLDIALNPGNGGEGSIAGDFFMPGTNHLSGNGHDSLQAFVDFADLDRKPRPIGVFGFNFPRRLLKKKVSGKIVLLLKLNQEGEVLDVEVDFSNLPDFNEFVLREVHGWKFTPPTQQGRPVQAKARLPIPITIN